MATCKIRTARQADSKLYKELIEQYGEAQADRTYSAIHSQEFKNFFGNWELYHNFDAIKKQHKDLLEVTTKDKADKAVVELNELYGKGSATRVKKADGHKAVLMKPKASDISKAVNTQGEPIPYYHLGGVLNFTSDKSKAGEFEDLNYNGTMPIPAKGEIRPFFLNTTVKGQEVTIRSQAHAIPATINTQTKPKGNNITELNKAEKETKAKVKELSKKEKRDQVIQRRKIAKNLVDIARDKRDIYNRQRKEGTVKKLDVLISDLEKDIRQNKNIEAILMFIEYANDQVEQVRGGRLDEIKAILTDPKSTQEEKREALKRLETASDFLSSFEIVQDIYNDLKGQTFESSSLEGDIFDANFADKYVGPIITTINEAKGEFIKQSKDILIDFYYKFNRDSSLTKDDLGTLFASVTDDVSRLNAHIQAMAESKDQVLELVVAAVQDRKMAVNKKSVAFKQTKLRPQLEKLIAHQGVSLSSRKLYDFMLEKDADGKITGKYLDPNKQEVKDKLTPEQLEFLNFFHTEYRKLQAELPMVYRKGFALPAILKSAEEIAMGDTKTAKDLAKNIGKMAKETVTLAEDEKDYVEVVTDENNKIHRFVPIKYTSSIGGKGIDPAHISLDLASSLAKFKTMVDNHTEMNSILLELEATKKLIAEREVTMKVGGRKAFKKLKEGLTGKPSREVTKKGITSNAYEMVEDYINRLVYGEYKEASETVAGMNLGKVADTLNKATAVTQLSFNIYSGINNKLVGETMNFIEASGGQFYNRKAYRQAKAEYWKNMPEFVKDATAQFSSNKINQWMEQHDMFQEFDDFGNEIPNHVRAQRMLSKSSSFLQAGGEHMIQTQMAIAMAKHHKVANGKILTYFEWLGEVSETDSKENKKKFEELPDLFSTLEQKENNIVVSSAKLKDGEMDRFAERVKGVYQRNHGNYSKMTKVMLSKHWYGRLAMLFRNWLKPGWDRRFAGMEFNNKEVFNQRLGANIAGNYAIAANFMKELHKDLGTIQMLTIAWNKDARNKFDQLPEWKKAGVKRTLTEIGTFVSLMVLIAMLGESDDDDDWLKAMMVYQAHRLKGELAFYVSPKEAMQILKSPTASLNYVTKLRKTMTYLAQPLWTGEGWEVYERGAHKGEYKWSRYAGESVPYFGQIQKWTTPQDYASYIQKNNI